MNGAIAQFGADVIDPEIVDTNASIDYQCALARAVQFIRHATSQGSAVISDPVWVGVRSTVCDTPLSDDVLIAADETVVGDVAQGNARGASVPARVSCE